MSDNIGTSAVQPEQTSYIARTSGLATKDYIGYAMGDTAGCLVFGLVTSFLQKFYTDIFFLDPLFIMLMFIGARVWDAINDPIMGRITDTIKLSKWGRYRPWFLWAAGPLILSTVLMFIRWPGLTGDVDYVGTCVYATVTYVMFGMSYTMLQIPYGGLASVVTTDEKERTKLSVFRSIGAGVGSVPAVLIASFCYETVGTNPETNRDIEVMQYTPIIIGVAVVAVIALVMLILAFFSNKERIIALPSEKREKGETLSIVKNLFKNRAFLSVSVASMLLLAGQMFTQSFYLYLFDDYFGMSWMNLVSTVCTYAPMAIFMFFTPKMVRKFGKKEICGVGMILAAAANLGMFALRGTDPDILAYLFMALCFVSGMGLSFIILQVWSMATDAIDEIEIKTNRREDGTAYSFFMFFRKLGQVIAAIAVNGALLAMNYDSTKGAIQSPENISVMYDLATIIPAVLFGLMAVVLLVWYPLSKKKVAELQVLKEAHLRASYESNAISIENGGAVAAAGEGEADVFAAVAEAEARLDEEDCFKDDVCDADSRKNTDDGTEREG